MYQPKLLRLPLTLTSTSLVSNIPRSIHRCYRAERHTSLLPRAWVLTNGNTTDDLKTTRIAKSLDIPFDLKPIHTQTHFTKTLYNKLSSIRSLFDKPTGPLTHISETTGDEFPLIAIASSPETLPALLELGKRTNNRVFSVYVGLPDTKLSNIDVLVLSRLDQMHLRHLGPARANLDNAVSTLLPLSGTTVPRNNPAKTSVDQKQSIVVCIGSGHNRAGFQLLIQDVDSLANGIACVSKNTCVKILLAQDIQKELKTVINSRLVNKLQALISDTENPGDAPLSIEVIDYSVPNNQHPTQEDVLAAASQVVVTADNIAAVSMAVSLHRPVYVAGEERTTHILRNYYHLLDTKNLVRRFYPEGSRYSYMLRSNISGEVDRFSATRDHEPWLAYNAEADLKTVVKFINQKLQDVYT